MFRAAFVDHLCQQPLAVWMEHSDCWPGLGCLMLLEIFGLLPARSSRDGTAG